MMKRVGNATFTAREILGRLTASLTIDETEYLLYKNLTLEQEMFRMTSTFVRNS